MGRIEEKFAECASHSRTALVAYVTVGYPNLETSYEACIQALEGGADILELGVPFSDPSADGPVIAAASFAAIGQGGSLKAALAMAERIRATRSEPIVLFTYYNPITVFGDEELVKAAAASGVDGLLIVDLPPDEGEALRAAADAEKLCVIPLVAPTSGPEREAMIGARARGFIYYVSVTGVTGAGVAPLGEAGRNAKAIAERFHVPVVVGFGIDSADKAVQAKRAGAPGVVVGTAIIRAVGDPSGGPAKVRRLVSEIRAGLDAAGES